MSQIDFEAMHKRWEDIYSLSIGMLGTPEMGKTLRFSPEFYIRDLRTLHMGGGRQNGASSWALAKLVERPNDLLIVQNSQLRDFFKGHPHIKNSPSFFELRERIFTGLDIASMLRTKKEIIVEKLAKAERIFIDDASYRQHLEKVVRSIAEHVREDVIIVALK